MVASKLSNTTPSLRAFRDELAKLRTVAEDGSTFYDVWALLRWMKRTEEGNSKWNGALLFLDHDTLMRLHGSTSFVLVYEGNTCLIVFAILVHLKHGEMIDTFQNANIVDRRLEMLEETDYAHLERDLGRVASKYNIDIPRKDSIDNFKRTARSFCPAKICYRM